MHHQLRVGNVEFSELFPRMVWHNDEPLDFANSVHIFALSRAREAARHRRADRRGLRRAVRRLPALPDPGTRRNSYRHVPRAAAPPGRHAAAAIIGSKKLARAMPPRRRRTRCSTTPATCGRSSSREACPDLPGFDVGYRRSASKAAPASGSTRSAVSRCSIRRPSWSPFCTGRTR